MNLPKFNQSIYPNKCLFYKDAKQFAKVYFVNTVVVKIRQSFSSPKFLVLRYHTFSGTTRIQISNGIFTRQTITKVYNIKFDFLHVRTQVYLSTSILWLLSLVFYWHLALHNSEVYKTIQKYSRSIN